MLSAESQPHIASHPHEQIDARKSRAITDLTRFAPCGQNWRCKNRTQCRCAPTNTVRISASAPTPEPPLPGT